LGTVNRDTPRDSSTRRRSVRGKLVLDGPATSIGEIRQIVGHPLDGLRSGR